MPTAIKAWPLGVTNRIMNIIKAISKEKLVILVTHEVELAKFYASRIIEIKDRKG